MAEKKKKEKHTTFEVGPISESRMRAIMEGLWQEGGAGRTALAENITEWYKPEMIRKSKAVADLVKSEFLHAWNGYKQYAWGHDYLMPLSRAGGDIYGVPFGITIIDSLDTLYVMEEDTEFNNAVEWVGANVNFNKNVSVSPYTMSIEGIGGLLSAYLICGSNKLLELATDLANRLLPAFASPTGMPYRYVNLATGATSNNINQPSHIGPLMLEWGTLSKLTGNPTYYNTVKTAIQAIYNGRSVLDLIGRRINVDTGVWTDTATTLDDYVEYNEGTIKGWLLFNDVDLFNWGTTIVRASTRYMAEIYNGMLWFRVVNMNTGALVSRHLYSWGHNYSMLLMLCGRTTEALEFARSVNSAWSKWILGPEMFDYSNMSLVTPLGRGSPEFIEALFHLYYITGDESLRFTCYKILLNYMKYCKYDVGYTRLLSVVTQQRDDYMPPAFLAETLKYIYLLFADSPRFIYNPIMTTEAHFLRGLIPT